MYATSLDMRRAALIRQDEAAQSRVPLAGQSWKDSIIMAQPAISTTLSAEELHAIEVTAAVWRSRGHASSADNLLLIAGLTPPAPVLPSNVYSFAAARAARAARQAVTR